MKVKDLKQENLVGIKIKIPKKFQDDYVGIVTEMYIYSWWNQGIWLKKNMKQERIYPLTMDPKEVLEFTVISGE